MLHLNLISWFAYSCNHASFVLGAGGGAVACAWVNVPTVGLTPITVLTQTGLRVSKYAFNFGAVAAVHTAIRLNYENVMFYNHNFCHFIDAFMFGLALHQRNFRNSFSSLSQNRRGKDPSQVRFYLALLRARCSVYRPARSKPGFFPRSPKTQ